ncbi:hypothetical protein KC19_8G043100 [Ceratodon purpureus]|uniref:Retinoblastoma-related protein n=1 Tax=Ceratodon purpureus TaxID=3225 RepID=A0A8T0GXF9_CERPU|nr:hypothetical protein KC19_8G043100 [Ceratodon purpureus]
MPEGRGIDLNGDTLSRETKEAQSPLKSENSQPKRRSPLRPCKVENIDDDIDTGSQPNGQPDSQPNSQPRQGEIGGPSTNGSDTKSRTKSNSDKFLEALETRFRSRCEVGLCLNDGTTQEALRLFRASKYLLKANINTIGTGTVEETERLWSACVLYVVRRLSAGVSGGGDRSGNAVPGFTFSQLLRETKLSVVEFFKELPQFLAKAGPTLKSLYGEDWERRLQVKEVQANFVHLMVLYNYYKRIYQHLFIFPETQTGSGNGFCLGGSQDAAPPVHMRFGWMLFLALRMHVLSHFTDLVTCTNGLLAVIIVLIIHTPLSWRRFSFDDKLKFAKRSSEGVNLVGSLCYLYNAAEEDVSCMVLKLNEMLEDLMKSPPSKISADNMPQISGINSDGIAYFEDLMKDDKISSNLLILENDYSEWHCSRGELDERMFINGEDSLIGAVSSGSTPSVSGVKRKHDTISSPGQGPAVSSAASPSSPCNSPCSSPPKSQGLPATNSCKPPPTPVSITMTTAKWLRTVIAPLPAEPSPDLQKYFQSGDRNIASDVKYRADVILGAIFQARNWRGARETGSMDNLWADQRRLEALKLYYKALGTICKAEAQRLRSHHLTFLSNERFHRCMLACSAELVLASHKTVTMTFPAVLEPTGITAFDLSKVIENFVRHEESLPRELKRHLNSIEERILESMAWEKGSSMYDSLIISKPKLASEINRLNLMADPMPCLDALRSQYHPPSASADAPVGGFKAGDPSGEPVEAAVSPPHQGSAAPVKANGSAAAVSAEQAVNTSFMSPGRRPSAFAAFNSPSKRSQMPPLLLSAFASPQRPNPHAGGETCAETAINVFFQKVMKLAAVRIRNLCDRLQQSQQVQEHVFRALRHALNHETILFFNRHIDQVVLCCLYGICKVSKSNVTFRDIVYHYRKQPQCKPNVFRNVLLDVTKPGKAGQETGDIIKFYNEVFVPSTKSFLLHMGSNAGPSVPNNIAVPEDKNQAQAPASPRPSTFPSLPDMSPKKVSAKHNVYVSPLPSNKVDSIMSPHTRSLYACVGESTQAFQSPSKDLTDINNRLNNRRLGRLDFGAAAVVSDSLVANTLNILNGNGNSQSIRLKADPTIPRSWSPSKRSRSDR